MLKWLERWLPTRRGTGKSGPLVHVTRNGHGDEAHESTRWRVAVFVDVQNLYHTAKTLWPGHKINYRVLRDYILEQVPHADVITFHAFTAINPEWKSQEPFLWALSHIGYRVITKPIRRMPDGSLKGDMDMDMALEILFVAPHVNEVVLVTGDGDFVPLVHQLVWMGKIVRVIGPGRLTAQELVLAAHGFTSLDQIDGILIGEEGDPAPLPAASEASTQR